MSRQLKKLLSKFFPPSLFFNPDMKNLHFVLSLHDLPDDLLEDTIDLLQVCGANVSLDLKDVKEHSIIIVDHDLIVSTKAPAFNVQYIKDCLKHCKIQDITKYRQLSTSHIVEGIHCMNIVYYMKKSWSTVMNTEEKKWLGKHVVINEAVDSDETVYDNEDSERRLEPEDKTPDPAVVEETPGCSHWRGAQMKCESSSHIKQVPYEVSDNEEPQKEQGCESTSYTTLASDENLDIEESPEEQRCKAPSFTVRSKLISDEDPDVEELPKEQSGSQQVWMSKEIFKRKSAFVPDKEKEVSGQNEKKGLKKNFSFWSSDEDSSECEVKENKLYEEKRRKKHTRQPYSDEEKINILKYIVSHDEFTRIKGRDLWVIMERRKVCPLRTWQSMKEHFLKKIIVNLDRFEFLTKSDKIKFIRAYTNT